MDKIVASIQKALDVKRQELTMALIKYLVIVQAVTVGMCGLAFYLLGISIWDEPGITSITLVLSFVGVVSCFVDWESERHNILADALLQRQRLRVLEAMWKVGPQTEEYRRTTADEIYLKFYDEINYVTIHDAYLKDRAKEHSDKVVKVVKKPKKTAVTDIKLFSKAETELPWTVKYHASLTLSCSELLDEVERLCNDGYDFGEQLSYLKTEVIPKIMESCAVFEKHCVRQVNTDDSIPRAAEKIKNVLTLFETYLTSIVTQAYSDEEEALARECENISSMFEK